MIKALIFDCDGVLVDTERDGHRVGFNKAFAEFGIEAEWDVDLYGKLLLVAGGKERMQAYFDESRKEPGKISYGTSGVGSTLHMAMELILAKTGIKMVHVPYKGGMGAPYNDLVGGRLDMHVATFSSAQPLMKTDKMRALAVTSKERHPGFKDVPTIAETLVPDYDVVSWLGFTSTLSIR